MSDSIYDKMKIKDQASRSEAVKPTKKAHRFRSLKGFISILIIFVAVLNIDILASCVWFQMIKGRDQSHKISRVDAAIILMGGLSNGENQGREMSQKIEYIRYLFEQNLTQKVLLVGQVSSRSAYDTEYSKALFVNAGIAKEYVLTDAQSQGVINNWNQAIKTIQNENWRRIALVSSPLVKNRLRYAVKRSGDNDIYIRYAGYAIDPKKEQLSLLDIYKQIHLEWLYGFLTMLPKDANQFFGVWGFDEWLDKTIFDG